MQALRVIVVVAALAALTGCAPRSKFQAYDGAEVTSVVVNKSSRRMYLLHHDQVLKSYEFELGFAPEGHKRHYGDGRTPEGAYFIDRRNPNSSYHLSIGISYPNPADVVAARAMGWDPGGDIFIHGTPEKDLGRDDWTVGCIAVTNREMEEIYAMVKTGTPIYIRP